MFNDDFLKAIKALKNGNIVVYPTDTLYAMGADIFNKVAVRKIFMIKKRPFDIPIPAAVSSIKEIEQIAILSDKARKLAECFLPGALTLILNKKDHVSDILTSNLKKIAIRIPNNDDALKLLSTSGPLTVTSANIHSQKTPFTITEIKNQLKDNVDVYLDGGNLEGLPSTIIDMTYEKPKIVRDGIITKKEIFDVI